MKWKCNSKKEIFFSTLLLLGVFFLVRTSFATSLNIVPSSGIFQTGDEFEIDVLLSSEGQAINAISGSLMLEISSDLNIISISTDSSIIPLWILAPSFSQHSVSFEGIIPNPGFMGTSGNVITATVRAISHGTSTILFGSSQVLANDGIATDVLTSTSSAVFVVARPSEEPEEPPEEPESPEEPTVPPVEDVPGESPPGTTIPSPDAPVVISHTHSDQEKWYADDVVSFSWTSGSVIESARIDITEDANYVPKKEVNIEKREETRTLDDGIWYIHVQVKNSVGWGDVAHYKVHIDTQEPSYINVYRGVSSEEAGLFSSDFIIDYKDIPSGMEYFEITIDERDPFVWMDDGAHTIHVEGLSVGDHRFVVKGFDHAGNSLGVIKEFSFTLFDPTGVGEIIAGTEKEEMITIGPVTIPVRPEIISITSYAGFGFGLGQILVVFGGVASFTDLWLLLLRLVSFVASFFRRRKSQPWGVVYDSVTKQPLDPAYVVIKENGEQKGMAITDLDGRYGFLVERGCYTIEANKTHYTFPSKELLGKKKDKLYNNLYFGEEFEVGEMEKGFIHYNIPLDPVGFDWNEFAKQQQGLFVFHSKRKRFILFVSNVVFYAGFALSVILLWHNFSLINVVVFSLYAGILIFQSFWKAKHPITKVMLEIAKQVVPFAIIKAFLAGNDRNVKTVVADHNGQFYLLTPPGKYYFTVEVKKDDGSYSRKYKTDSVNLTKGVVLKNLYVNRE